MKDNEEEKVPVDRRFSISEKFDIIVAIIITLILRKNYER